MSVSEISLQAKERNLVREQELWAQKKVDAERDLAKLQAGAAVLEPKVSHLREYIATLEHELSDLRDFKDKENTQLASIKDATKASQKRLDRLNEEIHLVGQEIATKRCTIDDNMEAYRQEKLKEVEAGIDKLQMRHTELSANSHALGDEIIRREAYKESLQNEISELGRELEGATLVSAEEINKLQDDMLSVRRTNERIIADNLRLETTRTRLEEENDRISKENAKFNKWRQSAVRQLEDADKALQEREAIVEQKEQYRPRAKSFLPPTTE